MPMDYVHQQDKKTAKCAPKKPDGDLEAAQAELARVTSAYRTGREMYERLYTEYSKAQGDPKGPINRELEDARKQLARAQQAAEMERERANRHAAKGEDLEKELAKTQEAKRAVEKLNTELARGGRAAEAIGDAQRKRADALAQAEAILSHIDVILGVCQNSCHPDVRDHLRETQETIREFVRGRG